MGVRVQLLSLKGKDKIVGFIVFFVCFFFGGGVVISFVTNISQTSKRSAVAAVLPTYALI